MRPLYIFDLDGTLALIEHRRHLVEGVKQDWNTFFKLCVDDTPNYPVIRVLQDLRRMGAEIWIWSGRSDAVKKETLDWLMTHKIIDNRGFRFWLHAPERFMMRRDGDYTPDTQLKQRWLLDMEPPERRRLIAAFDDRKSVVDMWRSNGVACFQVADGNF